MQRIDQLLEEIKTRGKALNVSIPGLAKLAGLGQNTLRGIESDAWSPSRDTIRSLQDCIEQLEKLSLAELQKVAGTKKVHPPKILGVPRPKQKRSNTTASPKCTIECAPGDD